MHNFLVKKQDIKMVMYTVRVEHFCITYYCKSQPQDVTLTHTYLLLITADQSLLKVRGHKHMSNVQI